MELGNLPMGWPEAAMWCVVAFSAALMVVGASFALAWAAHDRRGETP